MMFYLYNEKVKETKLFLPEESESIILRIDPNEHKVIPRIGEDIIKQIKVNYMNRKDFNSDVLY